MARLVVLRPPVEGTSPLDMVRLSCLPRRTCTYCEKSGQISQWLHARRTPPV